MRRFELLETETSKTKLTIAVDRITVKVPKGTDEAMKDRMNRFACKVAEKVDYPVTVRGFIGVSTKYNGLTTALYTKKRSGKREKIFTFNENEMIKEGELQGAQGVC